MKASDPITMVSAPARRSPGTVCSRILDHACLHLQPTVVAVPGASRRRRRGRPCESATRAAASSQRPSLGRRCAILSRQRCPASESWPEQAVCAHPYQFTVEVFTALGGSSSVSRGGVGCFRRTAQRSTTPVTDPPAGKSRGTAYCAACSVAGESGSSRASGNRNENVLPCPTSVSTQMAPPIASTSWREI